MTGYMNICIIYKYISLGSCFALERGEERAQCPLSKGKRGKQNGFLCSCCHHYLAVLVVVNSGVSILVILFVGSLVPLLCYSSSCCPSFMFFQPCVAPLSVAFLLLFLVVSFGP
jgi:hypothetical protein